MNEKFEFTWQGKKESVYDSIKSISKKLIPDIETSVDWDKTKNIYIEGDNLEALKFLQKGYMGKIKMIYIDPPYNTGNDFIYKDDFAEDKESYEKKNGDRDEDGNRLVPNLESDGRFHSNWCSMIYPRLKLARNLLSDDGVIFISIDDNEQANLRKICDEVFGEDNFLGIITWSKKRKGSFLSKGIISLTEYSLVYSKNASNTCGLYGGKADENESQPIIKRTNKVSELKVPANTISTKLPDGTYPTGKYGDNVNPVSLLDDVIVKDGFIVNEFKIKAPFIWTQRMFDEQLKKGCRYIINTNNFQIRAYKVQDENSFKGFPSYLNGVELGGTNEDAYEELEKLFGIKQIFDYSKPVQYIKKFILATTAFDKEDAIILDFFSGSATTAHAVMQLNAEDGGNRRFILVQLPEECRKDSEAFNAGYKNICDIGKERIRRAGSKIKKENEGKDIDIGFRVFKIEKVI